MDSEVRLRPFFRRMKGSGALSHLHQKDVSAAGHAPIVADLGFMEDEIYFGQCLIRGLPGGRFWRR